MNPSVPTTNASSLLPLYPRLLGEAWAQLDGVLRQAHLEGEQLCLIGTFRIYRSETWLGRLAAMILRLPAASEAVATRLTVLRTASGEKWIRLFAHSELITTQMAAADGTMRERFGMIEISCRLEVDNGAILGNPMIARRRLHRVVFKGKCQAGVWTLGKPLAPGYS